MADLRTDAIKSGNLNDGREYYMTALEQKGYSFWQNAASWELTGKDQWNSWAIRQFTPIHEPEQFFKSRLDLRTLGHEIDLRTKDGTYETLGVDEDGRSYRRIAGEIEYEESKAIRLYVSPMKNYFEWPFTLAKKTTILHAGEVQIEGVWYSKLFITDGDPAPREDADQYIVYINRNTLEIEKIQLTLRTMLESWSGVLHYADFRKVNGIVVAHKVTVTDEIDSEEYVHEYTIREMSFR